MSFDDDSFYFETRQVVERNQNNLIDSCSDYRDKIALFLKSHFYDVNEIEKQSLLNINSCFTEFLLNFSCSFN